MDVRGLVEPEPEDRRRPARVCSAAVPTAVATYLRCRTCSVRSHHRAIGARIPRSAQRTSRTSSPQWDIDMPWTGYVSLHNTRMNSISFRD